MKKTKSMLIGSSPKKKKKKSLDFYVNKERVEQVTEFKYLGLLNRLLAALEQTRWYDM